MRKTIFALATGALPSAVAIVRISGPQARDVSRRLLGFELEERVATYVSIRDIETSEIVDTGLAVFFAGPKSFTGEDCLELQVHGSRAVVSKLFKVLGSQGNLRLAEPGEFIRRAFENGKTSLTRVEGIADLIDARTETQRKQALAQAGGHLADRAGEWRHQIMEALSLIAAEIDFADEGDAPSGVMNEVQRLISVLSADMSRALDDASRGELIRTGIRIVLAGEPNAGKSSLLNALVKREAAIVTEVAGTTRDVIEVELDLGGQCAILCDTAGLRDTVDRVEAIGIERAKAALKNASLVLWLADSSGAEPHPYLEGDGPTWLVATKLDLVSAIPSWADQGVSATTGVGIDRLLADLSGFAAGLVVGEIPLVTNERQRARIASAAGHLASASAVQALELVADELWRAASEMDGLLGRISVDDVLGSVFSRFCMGK